MLAPNAKKPAKKAAKRRTNPDNTASKERQLAPLRRHAFKPGESGNAAGRPKGSRNKVSEAFLTELYELWDQQGSDLIKRVAQKDPATIVRVTAQLVPKEFQVSTEKENPFLTFLERMDEEAKAKKLREPPAD
jgi:hypothetical protein